MHAFVTGATGLIGRRLVAALGEHGWRVNALVRHAGRAKRLAAGVRPFSGDLRDPETLRVAMQGAEVVFHLGAAVEGSWEHYQQVTVEGTRHLVAIATECGVRRFVHVSSIIVYDKARVTMGQWITEDWPLVAAEPAAGPYARSKVEAEAVVREANAPGLERVIVRPGLVYGPERTVFEHLGAVLGGRFVAVGGRDLLLPLVHIDSLADALIRLAEAPSAAGGTFHVVDQNETSRARYLQLLEELTGYHHVCIYLPVQPIAVACAGIAGLRRITGATALPDVSASKIRSRAVEVRYDTSKLEQTTGWRPFGAPRGALADALSMQIDRPRISIERVGVIGAGAMASLHVDALRLLRSVQVTGILDTNENAAATLAARVGTQHFTDIDRFYQEARPQIVHIATPPQTHCTLALEASARDVHVLVEKPAALRLEECDAMQDAAAAAAVTIGVDENFAFDPLCRRAGAAIARGELGELVHIEVFFGYDVRRAADLSAGRAATSWLRRLPGGLLEDVLPHPLSVVRSLAREELQPVHWQVAATGRLPFEFDDELRLVLAGPRVTANVVVSLNARPDDFIVVLHGTRRRLQLDFTNMLLVESVLLPGPKPIARGARVVGAGLLMLGQTARNTLLIATRRALPPGHPLHLIRAHYAALAAGKEVPAPLSKAKITVGIAETIWPRSAPAAPGATGGWSTQPRDEKNSHHSGADEGRQPRSTAR